MGRERTGKYVECEICGKETYKRPSELARSKHHYCSNACRYEGYKGERPEKQTGKVVHCEVCGKEVYKQKGHLERQEHHFCSRQCAGEWRTLQAERKKYICLNCGKEFERLASRENHADPKYCSRECAQEGRTGENHPLWEGGRQVRGDGYVDLAPSLISDEYDSMRRKDGRVFEHRLVMAQHIGRPLESHEVVHHVNGDKSDNRIENLELHPRPVHEGITVYESAKDREIEELQKQIAQLKEQVSQLKEAK